jgi:rubrerythrin
MIKPTLIKTFKEKFLPREEEARDIYDQMLQISDDEEANNMVAAIRDDEIRHIELCKRAIEILEK